MTHDELLFKVQNRSELEDCWMALQKVVELHKPDDYCCPVCGPSLDICGVEYPCPTIRAIEKELR